MSANFKMNASQTGNDLHIDLIGDFDGSAAWELIHAITEKDTGTGAIILNTNQLGNVVSFGRSLFENLMMAKGIPRSRILFKGEKCALMAIDGCGQFICTKTGKPCRCGGECHCRVEIRHPVN